MEMDDLLMGVVLDGDLKTVRQPVDFLGVNYYAPAYVRLDLNSPSKIAQANPPKGAELDAFGRHIDPSGLFEVLDRVRREYGAPKLLVTENGCSDPFGDGPAILKDQFRIDYLRRHLQAVLAAREAGCDVRGYFEWTLIDNFEWDLGYTSKFGLVAMDRKTGIRTPKASCRWYAQLAASGLLPAG
jgi:beta-glucosidase